METKRDKAHRMLTEGRITILGVNGDTGYALCRSDGVTYEITWKQGVWRCSCLARTTCAHRLAVGHVITTKGKE